MNLSAEEKGRYCELNGENIEFLMKRYNRTNRWVIADMLKRSRYHYPDKTALVHGELERTYTQLEDECNQVANALLDLGIKKYDRVAILARNTHHHVLTWMGCAKIGAVYLALNYLLAAKDIAYCINHSEAKVFVVEDVFYGMIKDILPELSTVKTLIWSNQGAGASALEGFTDFDQWFAAYPTTEPDVELRIEDPVQMTYTSGTESLPKGVILTNQSLIAEYMGCIIDGRFNSRDINLNALPIFHAAQRDAVMNPIFWLGGTNILMEPNVDGILKNLARYKVSSFFAPPTVWIGLLRHPDFDNLDLSSLKRCYYGASIMPVEILKEILERLPGVGIYNSYGQTELSPCHTFLKAEDAMEKLGSAGMGGIHMETRIEDDFGNEITEPGVAGEICGRGPHVMALYFKDPEKTEACMENGWFHSGDLGHLDDDRYIFVVDRKKDMIKTGGENVSSREVEEAIYTNEKVEEVAVIGLDHPKWVEAVTAVVVPRKGEELTEEEIMDTCAKAELARFKIPKKVMVVDALPKSPTGKILKRKMRDNYKAIFC